MYLENGRVYMTSVFTGLPAPVDHPGFYLRYQIIDNAGNLHELLALDDDDALDYIKANFREYIYKLLSSDALILIRPNGFILAYVDTSSGDCTVKSMRDWLPDYELGGAFI